MKIHTRKQAATKRIQSQINITPLIDVLLVLLVIFMVITPVTPTGLDAAIPQSAPPLQTTQQKQPDSLILSVDARGTIELNHNNVGSTAELTSQLQDIFKTRSDQTVFVHGARSLDFEVIAHVIDAAIGGGASQVGLLTEEIQ